MRQIPTRLNNDGTGSAIIRCGNKPVAEMLAYTSSERDDTAAEFIERWNAFEPDGEVAQLRAENERLRAALNGLVALATPLVDDSALTFARAALGKGGRMKPIKRGRPFGTVRVPDDERAVKLTVSVRPRHIETAKRLGAGNASKGVQAALDAAAKKCLMCGADIEHAFATCPECKSYWRKADIPAAGATARPKTKPKASKAGPLRRGRSR